MATLKNHRVVVKRLSWMETRHTLNQHLLWLLKQRSYSDDFFPLLMSLWVNLSNSFCTVHTAGKSVLVKSAKFRKKWFNPAEVVYVSLASRYCLKLYFPHLK